MFSLMVLIFENRVLAYYSNGQTAEVLIQTSVRNTVFNGYCNILSKEVIVILESFENNIPKIVIDKLVYRFEILNHLVGLNR